VYQEIQENELQTNQPQFHTLLHFHCYKSKELFKTVTINETLHSIFLHKFTVISAVHKILTFMELVKLIDVIEKLRY
jgi:hypothetical protein